MKQATPSVCQQKHIVIETSTIGLSCPVVKYNLNFPIDFKTQLENLCKELINHLKMLMKLAMPHLNFFLCWRFKLC